ncbi:dihydropteroate synthase [Sagittula stellata]|uniref:Dihydropteroate synthase n=1 Tax=Sagittula stellata (strain ATCC 700073 / DSM 11524 / E-37) TaxID=388399 RepID=A3JZI4_SAGS3|nr:dihydropteroate synthase [Sagittula stellata]EBA09887.1 Dihydropteroate synthase, DHPS [Sagittula stellata E-37]
MSRSYYRPLVRFDAPVPEHGSLPVAGGPGWFHLAVKYERGQRPETVSLEEVQQDWRDRISAPRAPVSGVAMDRCRIMGILNVTPDSFSDGGQFQSSAAALNHARALVEAGADIIDVGGESTRPGALAVPREAEIARVEPVIRAIATEIAAPVSIDTRKSVVAEAAVDAGARLVNDISGFVYDPMLARFCAERNLPVCVMHMMGEPETMQDDPTFEDVLLDVYDFLERQILKLEDIGIPRKNIVVDPGIGFGKLMHHNLALLGNVSLYHGLGCAILVGASRKGFVGKLTGAEKATDRMPGSVACALAVAAQGVQIVRVHDVAETAQALTMLRAIQGRGKT